MESLLKPPEFARDLLSDHTDMDRSPHRISDADRAGIAVSLPDDAYFEYVWRDGAGKLHEDPQNPKSAQSIWYGRVSVIEGPEYRAHPVATASMETEPGGELRRERMVSEALQQTRRVNTYTPAGFQGAELPAILVQDGTAFHRLGRLASALDAVMDAGARPARLVFLEPVEREREYAFDRSYQHFVLDELMPRLDELAGPTGELHLLGTSLGGLAAATLALAAPEKFSGIAIFSAALLGSPQRPDPYLSSDEWVLGQLEAGSAVPGRWFVGTGTLEWLHAPNARLAGALEAAGRDVAYLERSAGHNWPNWRDMTGPALAHLLR